MLCCHIWLWNYCVISAVGLFTALNRIKVKKIWNIRKKDFHELNSPPVAYYKALLIYYIKLTKSWAKMLDKMFVPESAFKTTVKPLTVLWFTVLGIVKQGPSS